MRDLWRTSLRLLQQPDELWQRTVKRLSRCAVVVEFALLILTHRPNTNLHFHCRLLLQWLGLDTLQLKRVRWKGSHRKWSWLDLCDNMDDDRCANGDPATPCGRESC